MTSKTVERKRKNIKKTRKRERRRGRPQKVTMLTQVKKRNNHKRLKDSRKLKQWIGQWKERELLCKAKDLSCTNKLKFLK